MLEWVPSVPRPALPCLLDAAMLADDHLQLPSSVEKRLCHITHLKVCTWETSPGTGREPWC